MASTLTNMGKSDFSSVSPSVFGVPPGHAGKPTGGGPRQGTSSTGIHQGKRVDAYEDIDFLFGFTFALWLLRNAVYLRPEAGGAFYEAGPEVVGPEADTLFARHLRARGQAGGT